MPAVGGTLERECEYSNDFSVLSTSSPPVFPYIDLQTYFYIPTYPSKFSLFCRIQYNIIMKEKGFFALLTLCMHAFPSTTHIKKSIQIFLVKQKTKGIIPISLLELPPTCQQKEGREKRQSVTGRGTQQISFFSYYDFYSNRILGVYCSCDPHSISKKWALFSNKKS